MALPQVEGLSPNSPPLQLVPSIETPRPLEHYTAYRTREGMNQYMGRVDAVLQAVDGIAPDYEINDTYSTIVQMLGEYQGTIPLERGGRAWIAPSRLSEESGTLYYGDWTHRMPAMKYMSPRQAMDLVIGLPPSPIAPYNPDENGRQGYMLLAPVYAELARDAGGSERSALRLTQEIVNDTVRFAYDRMDAKVLGLGGVLPKVTFLGKTILKEFPDAITTTGHAGTVEKFAETAVLALQYVEGLGTPMKKTGFLGTGNIGESTGDVLFEQDCFNSIDFMAYDKKAGNLPKGWRENGRVETATSVRQLLEECSVVLSAVTERINLDDPEFEGLDLTGVVIVDDSQPGCFDRKQVEARGGKLLWVVAADASEDKHGTRADGYRAGLSSASTLWGCEAETNAIDYTKEYEHAIGKRVTPLDVRVMGQLMRDSGVVLGQPQSYGKLAYL